MNVTKEISANETTDFYVPFRVAWWETALMDPGAFYVTLGNSADFWRRLNTNDIMAKTPEIMRHYSRSLIELRRRLDDDSERTNPGTIANILAHVCLNVGDHMHFLLGCMSTNLAHR
jgi:hypothetical protein